MRLRPGGHPLIPRADLEKLEAEAEILPMNATDRGAPFAH